MSEIVCTKCGSINDYRTVQKSNNLVAYCNGCGSFIKNIPHDKPRLYVGKFKGIAIEEIQDLKYLQWAFNTLALSAKQKTAITDRIHDLQFLLR